ncbi:sugar phosphate isomerase/epimerase family protein [Streptosporangium sp. KLBMP 9127]|nr:sugar phosphate isomerase/epimerase [Streptosporangium sp. KLBMP 9127]
MSSVPVPRPARTWPFAVSTLGMPGLGLAEACRLAEETGCDGLELRAHPDTGVHTGLDAAGRASARTTLAEAGLQALALAGYVRIASPDPDDEVLAALRAEVSLAADLGAGYVRMFPGFAGSSAEDAEELVARRLAEIAPFARRAGVRVLIETHDSHSTGSAVRRLLEAAALPDVTGAVWDTLHTWRSGEAPQATFDALRDHLGYVQTKDAASATDTTPVPMGEGGVPLTAVREVLVAGGYPGWISLEWERTWYPEVAPVEEIIPAARAWAKAPS